jgi:hypothetical protein
MEVRWKLMPSRPEIDVDLALVLKRRKRETVIPINPVSPKRRRGDGVKKDVYVNLRVFGIQYTHILCNPVE